LALRKTFVRNITIVALLAVIVALSHSIWFRWLGEFLVKADEPFHADAAIVLAGDWNGDRVLRGAELVKQGSRRSPSSADPATHMASTKVSSPLNSP